MLDQSTVYGVGLVYISDIDYAQRRHIDKDFQPMSPIRRSYAYQETRNEQCYCSCFGSIFQQHLRIFPVSPRLIDQLCGLRQFRHYLCSTTIKLIAGNNYGMQDCMCNDRYLAPCHSNAYDAVLLLSRESSGTLWWARLFVCLSMCLSASISLQNNASDLQQIFVHVTAVVRYSSGSVAIRYVLPVLRRPS